MTSIANAEVASVRMKLTAARKEHLTDRVAEAARELAILWVTFSLLDRLVSGTLTYPWVITNTGIAIAVWCIGVYIELEKR